MGSRFKKRFRLLHVSMIFTEPGTEDQAKHEVIVPRTDVVVDIETEVVDDTKKQFSISAFWLMSRNAVGQETG